MNASNPNAGARRDIAAEITKKIMAELERGVLPWRKPWDGARTGVVLPRRAGGEPYRGVNVVMLWSTAMTKGYASPYWLTFKQAVKLGASVRKSERGEIVVYYGQATKTRVDEAGAETKDAFRFLKSYVAFNADQTDGLPDQFHPAPVAATVLPLAAHEAWFAKLDIKRIRTRDMACYIPSQDVIGMPSIAAFDTPEAYAATLDHEAVHATKAAHRVGRDMGKKFPRTLTPPKNSWPRSAPRSWARIWVCRRIISRIMRLTSAIG